MSTAVRPLGSSSWFEMKVRMRRFSLPSSTEPHGKAYSSGKRQNPHFVARFVEEGREVLYVQ